MRSRSIEKRNMFGIIKDIFSGVGSALKSLTSTDIDEPGDADRNLDIKAHYATAVQLTSDDVREVKAGQSATFGGISQYRTDGNVGKALKQHKAREAQPEKGGEARNRGERV